MWPTPFIKYTVATAWEEGTRLVRGSLPFLPAFARQRQCQEESWMEVTMRG